MLPYSFIGGGTFTNPATVVPVNIALSDIPDWFFVKNLTNWGKASTADAAIYSEWFSGMAAGSYLGLGQPSSSTPADVTTYSTQGTTGGFTFLNPWHPTTYPILTGTTINDSSFVVAMTNTGTIAVGDTVRITNATGMLQISGYTFGVTAVSGGSSITLGYMASAVSAGLTIAAGATACGVQKITPSAYYPRVRNVAYITQANPAVVYFTAPNDFTPGELVDFTIPTPYGMTQLSYLTGMVGGAARVLSVTNSSTTSSITINVDTTGFSAFTFPTSANYQTSASPATCYPAGSGIVPLNGSATVPQSPPGTNLQDAFDNHGQYLMNIGVTAAGAASTTLQWMAFKADFGNLSNA